MCKPSSSLVVSIVNLPNINIQTICSVMNQLPSKNELTNRIEAGVLYIRKKQHFRFSNTSTLSKE